jgi:hypothetical protein
MKKKRIEQVCSPNGTALYVNGKLVCDWFTCGHAEILKVCGVKIEWSYTIGMFHGSWPKTLVQAMKLDKK